MTKILRKSRKMQAEDTLEAIERGMYMSVRGEVISIRSEVTDCIEQTKLYTPDALSELIAPVIENKQFTRIHVVNETTLQGTKRLVDEDQFKRIGVLNFASAKNPGGGFLGGSQAQEETLARSSALYASLQSCPDYYQFHRRQQKTLLYSHHMIYSPRCPVFKNDEGDALDHPYQVDFITCPAPNYGAIAQNEPQSLSKVPDVFSERINLMLKLARSKGCDALVLGAWGCGVFRNPPEQVATYFADALSSPEVSGAFKQVVFSIPEGAKSAKNAAIFSEILGAN